MNTQRENKNELTLLIIGYIVLIAGIIALSLAFSGCNVERQAIKKKNWVEDKAPNVLMAYCASIAITDTVLIKGKDRIVQNYVIDTFAQIGDTTYLTDTLPCPPVAIPTPDTLKIKTIDTSGNALLRSELSSSKVDANKTHAKLGTTTIWAIVGWIVAIVMAILLGLSFKKL